MASTAAADFCDRWRAIDREATAVAGARRCDACICVFVILRVASLHRANVSFYFSFLILSCSLIHAPFSYCRKRHLKYYYLFPMVAACVCCCPLVDVNGVVVLHSAFNDTHTRTLNQTEHKRTRIGQGKTTRNEWHGNKKNEINRLRLCVRFFLFSLSLSLFTRRCFYFVILFTGRLTPWHILYISR